MLARRFPRELSAAESSLRVPLCDEAPLGAAAGPRPLRLALCAASRARPARGGSYLFLLLGVGGESCVSYVAGHQACKGGGCVSRPLSFAENKVDRFHVTSRVKCALRGSREWSASSPARTAPRPRPRRLRGQLAPARAPCRQGFPERGGDLRTGELLRP